MSVYDGNIGKILERGEILRKIELAGPTARDLCEAFEPESLYVEVGGEQVPAFVRADGVVVSQTDPPVAGPWGFRVCRPDLSPGRNMLRRQLYDSMCAKRRALMAEDAERKHDTTNHVMWKDPDGESRAAPEHAADHAIAKTGVQPMSHPKVWRPGA